MTTVKKASQSVKNIVSIRVVGGSTILKTLKKRVCNSNEHFHEMDRSENGPVYCTLSSFKGALRWISLALTMSIRKS